MDLGGNERKVWKCKRFSWKLTPGTYDTPTQHAFEIAYMVSKGRACGVDPCTSSVKAVV